MDRCLWCRAAAPSRCWLWCYLAAPSLCWATVQRWALACLLPPWLRNPPPLPLSSTPCACCVQLACATRTVRMKDFFADYDRLRCGHVPAAKFRSALAGARLELTDVELGLLETEYRNAKVGTGCVCVCVFDCLFEGGGV